LQIYVQLIGFTNFFTDFLKIIIYTSFTGDAKQDLFWI